MIPERYAPITYALFRIVFGFLFLCFGLQKMFGLFGGQVPPLASMPLHAPGRVPCQRRDGRGLLAHPCVHDRDG